MRASSSLASVCAASRSGLASPASPVSFPRELCIHHVLVGVCLALGTSAVAACAVGAGSALGGGARWQAREHLLEVGAQRSHAVEPSLLLERFARVPDELLGTGFFVNRQAVLELAEQLLDAIGERVELVARLDLLAPATVFLGVGFGVLEHLLDVAL